MNEHENAEYSSQLCEDLRGKLESKIVYYQSLLNSVLLLEELHRFGEVANFDKCFVNNFTSLSDGTYDLDDWILSMESRLVNLPFEIAFRHKNPEYITYTQPEILRCAFGDDIEWRYNPSAIKNMSEEDRRRTVSYFEYMCYYVINTRDELLFDIQDSI